MGSNIELFSCQSPDQKVVQPKNSDIGGYHIAFYVNDIVLGELGFTVQEKRRPGK